MTLLSDHNIAPRLIGMLADDFPAALPVLGLGLEREQIKSGQAAECLAILVRHGPRWPDAS